MLLLQQRPRVLSVELCEDGLRVNERGGANSFRWSEIAKVEESSHQPPNSTRVLRQVVVELVDQRRYLMNTLTIESFDRFLEMLRQRAGAAHVAWTEAETTGAG
jgi:hypothetical protein